MLYFGVSGKGKENLIAVYTDISGDDSPNDPHRPMLGSRSVRAVFSDNFLDNENFPGERVRCNVFTRKHLSNNRFQ